jgi:hypothetical protein
MHKNVFLSNDKKILSTPGTALLATKMIQADSTF